MIPRNPVISKQPWLKYSSEGVEMARQVNMTLSLTHALPHRNSTRFYRWKVLGEGADGTAFLMSSSSGIGCVIKFHKCPSKVKEEMSNWQRAYGEGFVRTVTLCKKTVLMMPYIQILDDAEFDQARAQIIKHVADLALRGIRHNDLHRRHVGWWTDERSTKHIRFIDWGSVIITDKSAEAVTTACNDAIVRLEYTM